MLGLYTNCVIAWGADADAPALADSAKYACQVS